MGARSGRTTPSNVSTSCRDTQSPSWARLPLMLIRRSVTACRHRGRAAHKGRTKGTRQQRVRVGGDEEEEEGDLRPNHRWPHS